MKPIQPMPQHEASDRGADYGPLTKWPMQAIRAETDENDDVLLGRITGLIGIFYI